MNRREPLSIEDVLKQSRNQGREPIILEKGKQELISFSTYTKEFETMLSLLDDAKKCVSNDLKEASLLIIDVVSEWLKKVHERSKGDFTDYLKV